MNHWFTSPDAPVIETSVKRFDPLHWSVDFPRGTIASTVTSADGHGLKVEAEFLRKGDLVGLIYDSEDSHAHPAHARETSRDYSRTKLSFRWQSSGAIALDQINGPTLTIEGRDAAGIARTWFVRLWNYAQGSGEDALITLDFDALEGGYGLPADSDPVFAGDIDRMFISIVPPDYLQGSAEIRAAPAAASVTLSQVVCSGSKSVLSVKDSVLPEHGLRIATAYDDLYNLAPERIVDAIERLGFRGPIIHYVGMSHYFALDGSGLLDPARPMNSAALEWHRDFARAAAGRGYQLIWSISYEILDMFCPASWKQRAFDGSVGLTGWEPPSALVSPANSDAIAFLSGVAVTFAGISVEFGLDPQVQIGEPWWWVMPAGQICLYDDSAKAAFGGDPVEIADVRAPLSSAQIALLDEAGALLATSTATISEAVKVALPQAKALLLAYLPSLLDPGAPELKRANFPLGWASPAFDVLQLEDYEWVTEGRARLRNAAYAEAQERLGYGPGDQHYLSGFVASASERESWREILSAALEAQERGVAEVFLWALPQVLRDGLAVFGETRMDSFDDVSFPIAIGAEASVAPAFSTNVVTSASGNEYRNSNWQQARLRFDAGPGIRSDSDIETLLSFFRARRGPAVGFRFRDPYDFSSNGMTGTPTPLDQMIGTGDGAISRFELTKNYSDGESRRITRPVPGSVQIAVGGVEQVTGWSLEEPGQILFETPPAAGAAITAGYLFDVAVRFAEDRIEVNRATFLAGEAPSVPLVEIREG
ncbi:MAG TPA: DUF2460 domain-containing protein [Sphingomicrobium sp.]|nr:DUF2460 domain-containing protein [Sphingomicrobium sp.]